jgi:hypothetical protein
MIEIPNIKLILEEIFKNKRSIIITLPQTINWNDYEKELKKTENYKQVLNFKVSHFPKGINKGDKCYVVYQGFVRGWMEIVGFSEKQFTCSTTKKKWDGKFIERSGPFHYLNEKIPYKGFQGFRYFDLEEYKLEKGLK